MSPASPIGGPEAGAKLYRSGPWLIAYGPGVGTEDLAEELKKLCLAAGITVDCVPVDEIGQVADLGAYFGLVLVLPCSSGNVRAALKPFQVALLTYRSRHPYGLPSLLNGRRGWHQVGVVQVVGPGAVVRHPWVRSALQLACVLHEAEPDVDLLAAYHGGAIQLVTSPHARNQESFEDDLETRWRLVRLWGVTDRDEVRRLREHLELQRRIYDDVRLPALRRPLGGAVPWNALDLILGGDWDQPATLGGASDKDKTLKENLARVWRETFATMRTVVPGLSRPARGPGAVRDLYQLYQALRILDDAERFRTDS